MKKRFLSVLLSFVMVVSMFTVSAAAEETQDEETVVITEATEAAAEEVTEEAVEEAAVPEETGDTEVLEELEAAEADAALAIAQGAHFNLTSAADAYESGEQFTVSLNNIAMSEAVVTGGIIFDPEMFTFVSAKGSLTDVNGKTYTLSPELSESGDRVGFYYMTETGENVDFAAGTMLTITFKVAKLDEPETSLIKIYEDSTSYNSIGETDEYQGEYNGKTILCGLPGVPTGITVSANPDKTNYKVNEESLDITGGKITVSFEGDIADKEYDITEEMVSGFDNTVLGTNTITVTFLGLTATFDVNIIYPDFQKGSGTEEDPYQVSNAYELNNVRKYMNAYFIQTADIVFTESDFAEDGDYYNDGAGWEPIGQFPNEFVGAEPFTGTYDGDGHVISGIYVNNTDTYCTGIFGYTSGRIENLGVLGGTIIGDRYVGGIAGYNLGYINHCFNTADITVDTENDVEVDLGGIVGYNRGGDIESCFNMGTISGNNTAKAVVAGGIVGVIGTNTSSVKITPQIVNCYNTGAVTANSNGYVTSAGGITGQCNLETYVKNSYNTGAVLASTEANIGGIAGTCYGTATDCYYLDITLNAAGGDRKGTITATSCTSKEMQTKATFAKFDFNNIWKMGPYFPELEGMPKSSPDQTIALDTARTNLEFAGEQLTLTASESTNSVITWTSSNESAVTVEKADSSTCTVKAVAAGSAVVTAEANGCRAYCIVTVGQRKISNCTIKLSQTSYDYDGKAKEPTVTVMDGDKQLTSSDYEVSYKNNDHAGKARVVVTGKGNYTGTLEKTFTINKVDQGDFATIDKKLIYLGETAKITCSTTYGNVSYTTSDKSIATVKGGVITPVAPGKATISVTSAGNSDYNEKTMAFTVTVGKQAPTVASIANTSTSGLKITWGAVTGATGYRIFRSVNGGSYTKIAEISADNLSYTDTDNLVTGNTYSYKMRSLYGTKYSSYSNIVSKVRVARPAISSITNTSGGLKLTWGKVTGASGYYVYRSINGGSYSKIKTITSGSTVTYTNTSSMTSGNKYTYRVQAYVAKDDGTVQTSVYSATKTTYRLARPVISKVSSVSSGAKVYWGKVTGATGYYVYRSINGGTYSKIKTITSGSTVYYTDTKATTSGKKYSYKIYAYKTVSGTTYKSYVSAVKSITK